MQIYSGNLAPLQRLVEDTNDQASDFTANAVAMSRQTLSRLEDINTRFEVRIFQNILFFCFCAKQWAGCLFCPSVYFSSLLFFFFPSRL